jgi:hypothetical protein
MTAPILEVATLYGPQGEFSKMISNFGSKLTKSDGFLGISHGDVIEKISEDEAGEKTSAYVTVLGWTSVEAHYTAVGRPEVAAIGKSMVESVKSMEFHHMDVKSLL